MIQAAENARSHGKLVNRLTLAQIITALIAATVGYLGSVQWIVYLMLGLSLISWWIDVRDWARLYEIQAELVDAADDLAETRKRLLNLSLLREGRTHEAE